jgi:ubiquitin C-terminal hydrolase
MGILGITSIAHSLVDLGQQATSQAKEAKPSFFTSDYSFVSGIRHADEISTTYGFETNDEDSIVQRFCVILYCKSINDHLNRQKNERLNRFSIGVEFVPDMDKCKAFFKQFSISPNSSDLESGWYQTETADEFHALWNFLQTTGISSEETLKINISLHEEAQADVVTLKQDIENLKALRNSPFESKEMEEKDGPAPSEELGSFDPLEVIGLPNKMNNCWVNALGQFVVHSPSLLETLNKPGLLDNFVQVYQGAQKGSIILNTETTQTVRQLISVLSGGIISHQSAQQEDLHEALTFLMGRVDAATSPLFNTMVTKRFYQPTGVSWTPEEYQREQKLANPIDLSQRSVLDEQNSTVEASREWHILLDLKGTKLSYAKKIQFTDLLASYFDNTHPQNGKGVFLKDGRLHEYMPLKNTRQFTAPPKYLTIALKRFHTTEVNGVLQYQKINKPVKIQRTFALPAECTQVNVRTTYHLVSFYSHVGKSWSNGHYVTYVQSKYGEWVKCNDNKVELVTEHDVDHALLTSTGLHYARRDVAKRAQLPGNASPSLNAMPPLHPNRPTAKKHRLKNYYASRKPKKIGVRPDSPVKIKSQNFSSLILPPAAPLERLSSRANLLSTQVIAKISRGTNTFKALSEEHAAKRQKKAQASSLAYSEGIDLKQLATAAADTQKTEIAIPRPLVFLNGKPSLKRKFEPSEAFDEEPTTPPSLDSILNTPHNAFPCYEEDDNELDFEEKQPISFGPQLPSAAFTSALQAGGIELGGVTLSTIKEEAKAPPALTPHVISCQLFSTGSSESYDIEHADDMIGDHPSESYVDGETDPELAYALQLSMQEQ